MEAIYISTDRWMDKADIAQSLSCVWLFAYMTPGRNMALTIWILVGKVMSLLLNMLSIFVITFLQRSKHLLISWHLIISWSRDRCFSEIPLLCSIIQQMLAIWSLIPLPFLNPAWTSGSSCFTQCWSLAYKVLCMSLLAWENSTLVWSLAHALVLPFLGIRIRIDLFQSCGHSWVFQICWHNKCKILMASSFRDVKSSAGISSHSLALLTAVLLKAHLTLHSRMSGSAWLTTPL